jgi:glycosyltransferase involved in cell wall biosynthesis
MSRLLEKPIRVLAVVPYPTGRVAGQRYRMEQWAPLLLLRGIDVTFSSFLTPRGMDVLYSTGRSATKIAETIRGYVHRVGELIRDNHYDVAYVYREASLLGPAWLERILAWKVPVVFDFDDAIYLRRVSPANNAVRFLKRPGKAASICRIADHVTVGNEVLAEFALQHSRRVTVIPSTIDTDVYRVRARQSRARPVVGWTGSSTTAPFLRDLAPALVRVRQSIDFELRVVGARVDLPGLEATFVDWRAESEAEDLSGVDVGLMPLPDDEWSRGKCGMKALQYMALGIPPIVSPVGANAQIVEHGRNGLHATTQADWVERISLLLRDPELRASLGKEARRTVEDRYSARIHAPRMAEVFQSVAA